MDNQSPVVPAIFSWSVVTDATCIAEFTKLNRAPTLLVSIVSPQLGLPAGVDRQ